MKRILPALTLGMLALSLNACGYNALVSQQESVDQAWSEVENQLQRRNDLIPNYVETVKGYATHEKEVFTKIADARAKLGGAGTVQQKMEASNELSSALSRLLVVVERYPDLKANQNFIRLQDELAGTENRIAVARNRYNDAVKTYNKAVRYFPTNLTAKYMLHMEPRETFQPEGQPIDKPPEVSF